MKHASSDLIERMRSLAGGFACDQFTCSTYSFTDDISTCENEYLHIHRDDCLTDFGWTCDTSYEIFSLNYVVYEGGQYSGSKTGVDYCETQAIDDGCFLGEAVSWEYGREHCALAG